MSDDVHDHPHDETHDELALVMPFVAATSNGGVYDDDAYVAGYEMGLLDARLGNTTDRRITVPLHAGNRAQADLVAMQHGYSVLTTAFGGYGEWIFATFVKEVVA